MKEKIVKLREHTLELLNELYEPFKIGDLEYPAGDVLLQVDPTAFRQIELSELDNNPELED